LSSKNDVCTRIVMMGHMHFGLCTSKTRKVTVKIAVSGSSWCQCNCIFTLSEAHNGLVRARNTNLSALTFKSRDHGFEPWSKHILIQDLTVLLLLQPQIHVSFCSSRCRMHNSVNQDGVSNEPVTFECHMCTYVLTCTHPKLSEIDEQTRFLGLVTALVRELFLTPRNTLRTWVCVQHECLSGRDRLDVLQTHYCLKLLVFLVPFI